MGRPFVKELEKIESTLTWIRQQDTKQMSEALNSNSFVPLVAIGSGGSFGAAHFVSSLYQKRGFVSKAITPLELTHSREIVKNNKVILISASGRHQDILLAHKVSIENDPLSIINVCMKRDSPLSEISSNYPDVSKTFEFAIPSRKDGFLATNSLVGFYGLFLSSFGFKMGDLTEYEVTSEFLNDIYKFTQKIDKDFTFIILYSGFGASAAIDLESKFSEAALGNVFVSDYRNFGHGRHHWLDKRQDRSAVISIETIDDHNLAGKTLSLLPKAIPKLQIKSKLTTPYCSLDLLIKSFHLVSQMGLIQGIDPGRPGVPEYGRKLYNLRYDLLTQKPPNRIDTAIARKANVRGIGLLTIEEIEFWKNAYHEFVARLNKSKYGCLILDYDGTLCSTSNRYSGISLKIREELLRICQGNVILGIATGRGRSVRIDLQSFIPKKYWKNIVIGYYNGSDIAMLDNEDRPKRKGANRKIRTLVEMLKKQSPPFKFSIESRPNQLSISVDDFNDIRRVKILTQQIIKSSGLSGIEFLESSHSIDVVSKPEGSKLNVFKYCQQILHKRKKPESILCIGDKGQWPGNDYELLSTQHSLSVDEVSIVPDQCWNLLDFGKKNESGLFDYLNSITISKGIISLRIT